MTATLRELADGYDAIDVLLEASLGELTPEIAAALDALDGETDAKIERCALVIVNYLSSAKAIKAEEERLAERRQSEERRAASLKLYLHGQMERIGKRKVEGQLATVAIQDNPPSVVETVPTSADDFRVLHERMPEFVTHVPESFAWNKRAILDAHKAGTLADWAFKRIAVVRTQSLRIR